MFLFLCLAVCFSLSQIPQLCSFSCYPLASHFPLLWADPVAKWLNHAICGTIVIFLSSSLWCQRLGSDDTLAGLCLQRVFKWPAGSDSSSGSDHKVQVNLHGIIEWFRLEGPLKIILFQPPCHGQGHLPLHQVAQSPVQAGLEHIQRVGMHSFAGQPLPVPPHPHTEEFFLCLIWIDPLSV